jgi:FkbM family methyltransferase
MVSLKKTLNLAGVFCFWLMACYAEHDIPKIFLTDFLPSDPVIVDAGAHHGYDSIEMAKTWPNARIFSFEPVPAIFKILEKNTKKFPTITPLPFALGKHNGHKFIYVSSGEYNDEPGSHADASSSFLKPKDHTIICPKITFEEQIEVEVLILDDWAKKFHVNHVDLLYLDLQGYELEVMKASPVIMSQVKALYTEVSLQELYEGVPLCDELEGWLLENGFKKVWEGDVKFMQKNVFFVRA